MRKFILPILSLSLLLSPLAHASFTADKYFPQAQVALYAKNLATGRVLVSQNADIMMQPASTLKILTALKSKVVFSGKETIDTIVYGHKASNGVVRGDLTIAFVGDPMFSDASLDNLIKQLKSQGISRIDGNLVINTGRYNGHDRPIGWNWANNSMCFASENGAAQYNYGCFPGVLQTGGTVGHSAPFKYSQPEIKVLSRIKIVNKGQDDYCEVNYMATGPLSFNLQGCIARSSNNLWMSVAVPNTNAFTTQVVANAFRKNGIGFRGVKQSGDFIAHTSLPVLAVNNSYPIDFLVGEMLNKSENHIAEQLYRNIAYRIINQPINYTNARLLNDDILSGLGLKLQFKAYDGSGLSYNNLITARSLVDVMSFIVKNDAKYNLLASFPDSNTGTLQHHQGLKGYNLKAKSGSFFGANNLVGVVKNAKGQDVVFTYLVNNNPSNSRRGQIESFEKAFMQYLYQQ